MSSPSFGSGRENSATPQLSGVFSGSTEAARLFVSLCERGIDDRPAIGGWHGTSLEAIQRALRLGGLAPSSIPHAKASAGHLFFYPPGEDDFSSGDRLTFQRCGRGGAMHYAAGNAQHHYLLDVAGLDHTNPQHHLRVYEVMDAFSSNPRSVAMRDTVVKLGVEPEKVQGVLIELARRKGFLIAIGRGALERYQPTDGDVPGEDKKIYVPGGLSFDDIKGIEPLGDAEFTFFEELQVRLERSR